MVEGVLRGFDPFMNLVVDQAEELLHTTPDPATPGAVAQPTRTPIGIVVCIFNVSLLSKR